MLKILLLFAFCILVCNAYDFKDPLFNQVILSNFQDLDDQFHEPDVFRFKRDLDTIESKDNSCKKKPFRALHCCNDTIDPKPFELTRDLRKQCFKEAQGDNDDSSHFDPFTCEKLEEFKAQVVCACECVAKKLNLLEENGDLKRDELIKHMKTKFEESDWKYDVIEEIVDKCFIEVKESLSSQESNEKKCNPMISKVGHCIWREYLKSCPSEKQIESAKCTKLREKLERGDEIEFHRGLFNRHFEDKK